MERASDSVHSRWGVEGEMWSMHMLDEGEGGDGLDGGGRLLSPWFAVQIPHPLVFYLAAFDEKLRQGRSGEMGDRGGAWEGKRSLGMEGVWRGGVFHLGVVV